MMGMPYGGLAGGGGPSITMPDRGDRIGMGNRGGRGTNAGGSNAPSSSSSSDNTLHQRIDKCPNFVEAGSHQFLGHKKEVHSVAWSSTGAKLASGSTDHSVRIWTLNTQSIPRSTEHLLMGHTSAVHQLCWDPTNPEQLATASDDKTVRIWDTRQQGRSTATIKMTGGNINIAWSPNGNFIAVGNKNDQLSIIDVRKNNSIVKTLKFTFEINEIAWSKDTDLLFLTTGRGGVEIMEWPTLERRCTLHAHTANCYCLKFSPKGEYFAVGSADALVSVWDVEELACIRTFDALQWPIRTVSFTHDSRFLASASEDLVIDISEVESGEKAYGIKVGGAINTMAWHPRSYILAYAEAEKDKHARDMGTIYIWDGSNVSIGPQPLPSSSASSSSSSSSSSSNRDRLN